VSAKPKIFRSWSIERDAEGLPCKLYWDGDFVIPAKQTPAELDAERLAEHEQIYGKREESIK